MQKSVNSSSRNISRHHSATTDLSVEDDSSENLIQQNLHRNSLINTSFYSVKPTPFPITCGPSDCHQEPDDQALPDRKLKDDIHAPSMRSLRDTMAIQTDVTSSLYSPKVCPICMETYEVGDDIAWSKNEGCCHAFHLDCISVWLMENDDCPMCRRDFFEDDNNV